MGGLEKAKVLLGESDDEMEVQFNPVSYNVAYPKQVGRMYVNLLGDGKIVSGARDEARTLNLDLIFYSYKNEEQADGLIAAVGNKVKDAFKEALGINNDTVRGNIDHLADMTRKSQAQEYNGLTFVWGAFIFHGLIVNMNVKYEMFSPNGEPAKAVVSIQMIETPDPSDFLKFGLADIIIKMVGEVVLNKLGSVLPS